MENREAINIINQYDMNFHWNDGEPIPAEQLAEAFDLAISALEKQVPKKPKRIDKNATFDGNWKKVCPACGRVLVERITTPEKSYPRLYNHTPHCICGQAIDWSEPYTEEES